MPARTNSSEDSTTSASDAEAEVVRKLSVKAHLIKEGVWVWVR